MTARRVEAERVSLRLTPMIDVVFLLLVFFMYTARFRTLEGQLGVFLPRGRASAEVAEELKKEMKSVTLSLRWEAGRTSVTLEGAEFQDTDPEQLFGYLDLRGAVTTKLLRLRELVPDSDIVIDSSFDVPVEYFVGAINSCVRAGWEKITFLHAIDVPPTSNLGPPVPE